jgi:hypothetical protein
LKLCVSIGTLAMLGVFSASSIDTGGNLSGGDLVVGVTNR